MNLPFDVLLEVLGFLSIEELCNCAAVSRKMNFAASHDSLWRRFLPSNIDHLIKMADPEFESMTKKNVYKDLIQKEIRFRPRGEMRFSLDSNGKPKFLAGPRSLGLSKPLWHTFEFEEGNLINEYARITNFLPSLNIQSNIPTWWLVRETSYKIYFVFQFFEPNIGIEFPPNLSFNNTITFVMEHRSERNSPSLQVNQYVLRSAEGVVERFDGLSEVLIGEITFIGEPTDIFQIYINDGILTVTNQEECIWHFEAINPRIPPLYIGLLVLGIEVRVT